MWVHTEAAGLISKRSFSNSHFSDRSCTFIVIPVRCSRKRMTAQRVLLGGEAVCSFLREEVVSFVNHTSVCVTVSGRRCHSESSVPASQKNLHYRKGPER